MIRSASIRNFFLAPFALWALLFVAVPLIVIAWYGVTNDDGVFSLSSLAMITRPGYFKALIFSLILTAVSTAAWYNVPEALLERTVENDKVGIN